MSEQARVYVERELMDTVKRKLPETKSMTYTGLIDYVLRKLLKEENNRKKEANQ